jgi:hypothetical protein
MGLFRFKRVTSILRYLNECAGPSHATYRKTQQTNVCSSFKNEKKTVNQSALSKLALFTIRPQQDHYMDREAIYIHPAVTSGTPFMELLKANMHGKRPTQLDRWPEEDSYYSILPSSAN